MTHEMWFTVDNILVHFSLTTKNEVNSRNVYFRETLVAFTFSLEENARLHTYYFLNSYHEQSILSNRARYFKAFTKIIVDGKRRRKKEETFI